MEKEIVLKPKKKKALDKIKTLFEDKKKRYLYVAIFILPFLILLGVFGYTAYKEAKNIINLIQGEAVVKKENVVESMNYILRDNATDIQKQYFAELKQAVEVDNASDEIISGLICKNYIADLYTWTNKQGQYDVSALYYVYTLQKNDIYLQVRDGFYKYLNNYINDFGSKNLLEVASVDVVSSTKINKEYTTASGETFSELMLVTCNWTYVPETKMDINKFAKSMNFVVVIREGRYEIVEASEKTIEIDEVEIDESEEVDVEE